MTHPEESAATASIRGAVGALQASRQAWHDRSGGFDETSARHQLALSLALAEVTGSSGTTDLAAIDHVLTAVGAASRSVRAEVDRVFIVEINRLRAALGASLSPDRRWREVSGGLLRRQLADSPPPGDLATVEEIHDWWDALSPESREHIINGGERWLGNVDGLPVEVRDRCNRLHLKALVAGDRPVSKRVRKALVKLQKELDEAREAGLDAYLIALETTGFGAATVSYNNPDTSDRVPIFLPGGGCKLELVDLQLAEARNLLTMMERLDASGDAKPPTNAVVLRQYLTGKAVPLEVLKGRQASDITGPTCRLLHGLRVTHTRPEPSYNVLVTHSYGSVLAGMTADEHAISVDRVATAGAPGSTLDEASQFGLPDGEVFSGRIAHDVLAWLGQLGFVHNVSLDRPEFGAEVYATQAGTAWPTPGGFSYAAHFEYFHPESLSLFNLAQIARGRQPIPARLEAVPQL